MSTSARMLQLLSLLQTHRHWPGVELAARLDVSPRTLRRDVDRLRELGYPVDAGRGVGGGYQLAAGAVLPPLVLDDDEAVAIAVGMQSAAGGAIVGIEESALRALTKVAQVLPVRLRRRVDALRAVTAPPSSAHAVPLVEATVLTTVAQAARDAEAITFGHVKAGVEARRHVEPHRLVPMGRRWYLVAYDLDRHGWRSFRLDRVRSPRATGRRFRPRDLPAADAAAFVQAGLGARPGRHAVEAVVHAPAARVAAELDRWGTVEEIDDHTCVLRCATDSLDWPAMILGAIGADFEVRSPPELIALLDDWRSRFSRAITHSKIDTRNR